MNLLITGGAGFIGANFINYYLQKYPSNSIVNLDLLTYAANENEALFKGNNSRYTLIKGDIANRELVQSLFDEYRFDGVIHFAAESHVDNSIINPDVFIRTNICGTYTLLDVARYYWMDYPHKVKKEFEHCRFHHISTDEVYGSLDEDGYFTEQSSYAPNSPYSASKAASDMLVRSYFHTYGLNVVTTNCSNNFGPMQHEEKLIPTIIRKALAFEPIPIYGTGKNVRDWLYVEDHCRAIDNVFHNGKSGETYLVGGNNEYSNIQVANLICGILDIEMRELLSSRGMDSFTQLITFTQDRAGHDFRYAIDATKIKEELGWGTYTTFNEGLRRTILYYLSKFN